MKKVAYVISNINKALAFEWIATYIDKSKIDLCFILINPGTSELEEYLNKNKIKVYRIKYASKKDVLHAIYKCIKFLRKEKTEVIHCHLFEACIIGLISGTVLKIKKRIYTRHHSTLHHFYYPKAVFFDKLINFMATHIVAISQNVKDVLMKYEGVKEKKIRLVHHGFVLESFGNADEKSVVLLKNKYNLGNKRPVIGVIARYTEEKGIQYIIPAFKRVLNNFPDAYLILANAGGAYAPFLKLLLNDLPKESFIEIKFEKDIFSLYRLFDVFVHVPIDLYSEAFGQVYIEPLASGVPSVFTRSGIAPEFIIEDKNALIVDYKNSDQIYDSVKRLLGDQELYSRLKINGKESVQEMFTICAMMNKLENVYAE